MIDVDGVLISGRPQDGQPWQLGLQADLGIGADVLAQEFFEPFWSDIVIGRRDIVPALTEALTHIKTAVSAQDILGYWFKMDSRVNGNLLNSLQSLRVNGTQIYLCTNQEKLRAEYLMITLGLGDHVDGIVYSGALGARKPDAEFFAKAMAITGCPSNAHLLIDDTAENLIGAVQAGWHTALWTKSSTISGIVQAFDIQPLR